MFPRNACFRFKLVTTVIVIGPLSVFFLLPLKLYIFEELFAADVYTQHEISLPIFKTKPLVIWTSDFHFVPTKDLTDYLEPMGVRFIDKSLDDFEPRCKPRHACNRWKTLKVITPKNSVKLDHQLIPRFYEAYKNDSEMSTVDAFACFHVSSLCELFEPFNKSLIIIATIRYELGRQDNRSWTTWNRNLIKYASDPANVVAANNLYDVEYIKYFTGIQPLLLPSWCNYTNQSYAPSRPGFLVAISHAKHFMQLFRRNFTTSCKQSNCSVDLVDLRHKYSFYRYSDIAAHQGIVHVPYQVSVMSFFEQYRMNIPIFAPSKELLVEWDIRHEALDYRRINSVFRIRASRSAIGPHPSQRSIPDPNSYSDESSRYWVQFCDYYQFPHVTYYNSIDELTDILQSITKEQLQRISDRMKLFNIQENKRLRKVWSSILLKIANRSSNHPY